MVALNLNLNAHEIACILIILLVYRAHLLFSTITVGYWAVKVVEDMDPAIPCRADGPHDCPL